VKGVVLDGYVQYVGQCNRGCGILPFDHLAQRKLLESILTDLPTTPIQAMEGTRLDMVFKAPKLG
jgi:hypothetical protein